MAITRLFTNCSYCGQQFYLNVVYLSKRVIPRPLELICPYCQENEYYEPNDILAEPGAGAPLAGAALGAIVGSLVGGPIGLLLGGALGGTAGSSSEEQDREATDRFNDEVV